MTGSYTLYQLRDGTRPLPDDIATTKGDSENSQGIVDLIRNHTNPRKIEDAGHNYDTLAASCEEAMKNLHERGTAHRRLPGRGTPGGRLQEDRRAPEGPGRGELRRPDRRQAPHLVRPRCAALLPGQRPPGRERRAGTTISVTACSAPTATRTPLPATICGSSTGSWAWSTTGSPPSWSSARHRHPVQGHPAQLPGLDGLGGNGRLGGVSDPYSGLGSPYSSLPGLNDPSLSGVGDQPGLTDPSLPDPSGAQNPSLPDPSGAQNPSIPGLDQPSTKTPDLQTPQIPDLKNPGDLKTPALPDTKANLAGFPDTMTPDLANRVNTGVPSTGPLTPSGIGTATTAAQGAGGLTGGGACPGRGRRYGDGHVPAGHGRRQRPGAGSRADQVPDDRGRGVRDR